MRDDATTYEAQGTFSCATGSCNAGRVTAQTAGMTFLEEAPMHGIIYLVGLIVVVMFILSLIGLR